MPQLPDELVEEVFLRLPPDEPAALVRASLASKPWLGVLTGPAFRGRYREFHVAPPMLGLLYSPPVPGFLDSRPSHKEEPPLRFVSTTNFGARIPHVAQSTHRRLHAWDCRHDRVLLGDDDSCPTGLVVWDPMTGRTLELYRPDEYFDCESVGVAVLCAVSGCDHRSCHAGPFKLVCIRLNKREVGECVAHAFVSSPDMGEMEWEEPCDDLDLAADAVIYSMPPILVDDALHFMLWYLHDDDRAGILKYSLSSHSLSLIDAPPAESVFVRAREVILMALKDGRLGFAHLHKLTLCVWSRHIDSNGVASWTHCRVVDLKNLLPIKNLKSRLRLIGSVEGGDIIFVNTDLDIYEIDLKTLEWKEQQKGENFYALFPYMSFYDPPERVIPGDAAH